MLLRMFSPVYLKYYIFAQCTVKTKHLFWVVCIPNLGMKLKQVRFSPFWQRFSFPCFAYTCFEALSPDMGTAASKTGVPTPDSGRGAAAGAEWGFQPIFFFFFSSFLPIRLLFNKPFIIILFKHSEKKLSSEKGKCAIKIPLAFPLILWEHPSQCKSSAFYDKTKIPLNLRRKTASYKSSQGELVFSNSLCVVFQPCNRSRRCTRYPQNVLLHMMLALWTVFDSSRPGEDIPLFSVCTSDVKR